MRNALRSQCHLSSMNGNCVRKRRTKGCFFSLGTIQCAPHVKTFLIRTPGPPPYWSMNSTPADLRVNTTSPPHGRAPAASSLAGLEQRLDALDRHQARSKGLGRDERAIWAAGSVATREAVSRATDSGAGQERRPDHSSTLVHVTTTSSPHLSADLS